MAAAPDPNEVLYSTTGKYNFQLVVRLLISGGTTLLRDVFDQICPPINLPKILSNPATVKQLKAAKLTKPQWDCLYPSPGVYGKSADFDVTLLFRLLRTICNLTPPTTGWDALPANTDYSLSADLVRIKYYRNSVYGHVKQNMEIRSGFKFLSLWHDISEALIRIAGQISLSEKYKWQAAIDNFLKDPLTAEDDRNVQELLDWYRKDLEIKKSIEELKNTTQEVQHRMERLEEKGDYLEAAVRDEAQAIKDHLEVVHQSIAKLSASAENPQTGEVKHRMERLEEKGDYLEAAVRDEAQEIKDHLEVVHQSIAKLSSSAETIKQEVRLRIIIDLRQQSWDRLRSSSIDPEPEEVPPEILARGRLALEAYNKAINEGKTYVRRVPIMLVGQNRSGKTSLKKSLKGQHFNLNEDSTVGIEVDPSYFKVSSEVWKMGKKGHEAHCEADVSYDHQVAQLTLENLRFSSDEPHGRMMDNIQSGERLTNQESVHASGEPEPHVSKTAPDASSNSHDTSSMPEEIATLVEKELKEKGAKVEDEEDIYYVFWDFGGQSVYYATHPLFLTVKAIYLLVFDISQEPHQRAKCIVKEGMYSRIEDSSSGKTNLDYLDFWMSSIVSLATQDETNQECPETEALPDKLPPVFLVCTHADTPHGGGDPHNLARNVFSYLQSKPYANHLFEEVFVVDNTKSGSGNTCSEVVRLHDDILSVAKELPLMKEAIPIKWLKYEKALQALRENGHNRITLERAKQIATEVCNIVEDEQFQTLLNFLHDQRILIHFDNTPELNKLVVLDPQWLVDVFRRVITIKPYGRKEKAFKELWCKLEEEGILREELLEHVWYSLYDDRETIKGLIAIMEKFSLLCPWPSSDASCSKQYLVPSMLMSIPPDDVIKLVKSAHTPSLFITFESRRVPPGLFPRLVLQFFEWGKEELWSKVNPQLYLDFARFYTTGDENCSVVLLCHSSTIEIVVHRGNRGAELAQMFQSKLQLSAKSDHTTFDETCARDVCRQLGLMLESMRKEFCWLSNMKYQLSVMCPVCCQGGAVNYCRTHRTRGCKQEECQHFWTVSELCNAKEDIFCTKFAAAQNTRIDVHQFAPWFVSFDQVSVDENYKRSLPSEEDTALSLCGEVVESVLTQSCDAKEVVLQLKECLQLDQTSLQQPETKNLIRCLARRAKSSDRLDVVKHFREITPAGTTGPLLQEHLNIRDIPFHERRELTIYLCGGDEWKIVAEALGLTPPEIRYLDNRICNPFDAALAHIANQHNICVGYLYDLLNECGLPVIADLL